MKIKWSKVILLTSLPLRQRYCFATFPSLHQKEKGFNDSALLKLDQLGLQLQLDAIFMQISVAKKN